MTPRTRSQQGSVLIAVMAIMIVVLLVGVALFSLGVGESDVVDHQGDGAKAFYLAEAGIERAWVWLEQMAVHDPPLFPSEADLPGQVLGDGTYGLHLEREGTGSTWSVTYEVTSTGTVDGVVRRVRALLENETFAQYLYFADEMEEIWFISGDTLRGKVHTNGHIRISGDPWFDKKVTTAQDEFITWGESWPTFAEGYELGVPEIPLPVTAAMIDGFESLADDGGLAPGPLEGSHAKYEVVLGRNGLSGYLTYRSYERVGWEYQWSSWTDVDIASTNGIAWFDEPIDISGVLDGQLTVAASGDIRIVDDVTYAGSSPGQGPTPGCDDVLGLASAQNVVVGMTTPNMDDCEIHAHMMALNSSFTAEDYWDGLPRGTLSIWGGLAQQTQGAVGQFNWSGLVHGYQKDYHYDSNLLRMSPPGYPPTGKYILVLWEELRDPEA